ncbi:MAG: hypothetical protein A3A44_03120 [Candidatus Sungbacteria bacterium RIFCSPLOWO2_01_FULL_60_25]|uniref:PrgI family protein n=1 Tax=Candidatus Sungbacteria bacterium RIFCSPLOWO2_01_FULL_60_25 TaxID=1802281 RepID=A0A1G2L9S4_9BACT|nr:MAG: hypothetical protein A3A44_03120 [Candidatus Sungbacteria bacterium RIFCSPLOWO2_01_FULL_60_25]
MKQYQVPQFINVEDRIIGPFTLKQFLYLLGAAGAGIVGFIMFHVVLFIVVALPIAAFFAALAFVKVQNQPLPTIVSNAVAYYTRPRLYIWKHVEEKGTTGSPAEAAPPPSTGSPGSPQASSGQAPPPPAEDSLTENKLSDLAWSLDIKEHVARHYR